MSTIVVQAFITLDGVVQAGGGPEEDREGGFEHGGWQSWYNAPEVGDEIVREWESRTEALLLGPQDVRDLCRLLGRVGRERRGPAGRADQEVQPHPQVRCVAHADRGRLEELAASRPRRAGSGGKAAGGAGRRDPRVGEHPADQDAGRARPGRRVPARVSTRSCSAPARSCSPTGSRSPSSRWPRPAPFPPESWLTHTGGPRRADPARLPRRTTSRWRRLRAQTSRSPAGRKLTSLTPTHRIR